MSLLGLHYLSRILAPYPTSSYIYPTLSVAAANSSVIGDERPCQRCIKRGLADACQDGVRKKAKHLHDVPREALSPVLGPNYNQVNNSSNNGHSTASTSTSDTLIEPSSSPFYPTPSANPLLLQAGLIQPESFNFDLEGLDSVALGFGMLGDMGTSNEVFGNKVGMTATRPCRIFSVPRPSAPNSATQDEARQALLTLLSFFRFQPGYVNWNKYMIIFKLWQDLTSNQSHDRLLEAPSRIESPQSAP